MGENSLFYTRHHWKALPPRRVKPLEGKVGHVVNTWSETDPCYTTDECALILQELQKKHLSEKLADIQSNFYVGGDGNIYEGRGWYNQCPDYPKEYKNASVVNGNCIEIAFIGRPGVDPDDLMIRASSNVSIFGTISKYIQDEVKYYFKTSEGLMYVDTYSSGTPLQIEKAKDANNDLRPINTANK